jgi:hypothetical protein
VLGKRKRTVRGKKPLFYKYLRVLCECHNSATQSCKFEGFTAGQA